MTSIVIQATRKARRAENASERDNALYLSLRDELRDALLNDPQRSVSTPGFKSGGQMSAADLLIDDLAGVNSDVRLHMLVRILGDAAKGEDVQSRAMAYVLDLSKRHAAFHLADAIMAEEYSE